MCLIGRPNFDDPSRLIGDDEELRFLLLVFPLPPRALNVGNLLPSSAAIALPSELLLVDGTLLLLVAVDTAKSRISPRWRFPIASSNPAAADETCSIPSAIFVYTTSTCNNARNALVAQYKKSKVNHIKSQVDHIKSQKLTI